MVNMICLGFIIILLVVLYNSRSIVTYVLQLFNIMPEVKLLLERGEIEFGHIRLLRKLPSSKQVAVANLITAKQLSMDKVAAMIATIDKT